MGIQEVFVGVMPMKMRHREEMLRVGLAVLGVVATVGVIAAVAVMPGVAIALKPFVRRRPTRQRYEVDRALRGLIRRGFVEEVVRRRRVYYQITDRGREYLMKREFTQTEFEKPKKWDGRWRLIVFDVSERRRHLRDMLRRHFQHLGLQPIQKSVWLFPYPCDDLVRLIKVDLGLGRDVQYFTVGAFADREEEKSWRLHFDV